MDPPKHKTSLPFQDIIRELFLMDELPVPLYHHFSTPDSSEQLCRKQNRKKIRKKTHFLISLFAKLLKFETKFYYKFEIMRVEVSAALISSFHVKRNAQCISVYVNGVAEMKTQLCFGYRMVNDTEIMKYYRCND